MTSKRSISLLILLTCLNVFQASTALGKGKKPGGVGDGGGGGVACYAVRAEAARAREALAKNGYLPEAFHDGIISLVPVDTFEGEHFTFSFMQFGNSGESYGTPREMLSQRIIKQIKVTSPLAAGRLEKAVSDIDFSRWVADERLPLTDDLGEQTHLREKLTNDPRCLRVPIIVQTVSEDSTGGLSVNIRYNPLMWDLLGRDLLGFGVANQAAMKFHEAMYFLGASIANVSN